MKLRLKPPAHLISPSTGACVCDAHVHTYNNSLPAVTRTAHPFLLPRSTEASHSPSNDPYIDYEWSLLTSFSWYQKHILRSHGILSRPRLRASFIWWGLSRHRSSLVSLVLALSIASLCVGVSHLDPSCYVLCFASSGSQWRQVFSLQWLYSSEMLHECPKPLPCLLQRHNTQMPHPSAGWCRYRHNRLSMEPNIRRKPDCPDPGR